MTVTPRVKPWVLTTFALALPGVMIPLNLWFGPSEIWRPVYDASLGLVSPTLIAGLLQTLILIVGIVLGLGRLPPRAIGLQADKLPPAIAWTLGAWLLCQVIALCGAGAGGQESGLSGHWMPGAWTGTTGNLLGQLLGNALAEELQYRGFLLVQFFLILGAWYPERKSAALAIFFAALVFAALHIPNRIQKGFDTADAFLVDQLVLIFAGTLFGWAYWRTRNLFAIVGFHSLVNEPSMLLQTPASWPDEIWAAIVFALLALYAWACPARRDAEQGP